MQVFVYTTMDPACPEGSRAIARIYMAMPSNVKGGAKMGFNPVIFSAADEATVRRIAEDWYASELAAAEARAGKSRGRPKKTEPQPAAIADEAVI